MASIIRAARSATASPPKTGLEQPVYYWDPVIAPSGLAVYHGKLFPQWNGNLLAGGLRGTGRLSPDLEEQQGGVRRTAADRSAHPHPRCAGGAGWGGLCPDRAESPAEADASVSPRHGTVTIAAIGSRPCRYSPAFWQALAWHGPCSPQAPARPRPHPSRLSPPATCPAFAPETRRPGWRRAWPRPAWIIGALCPAIPPTPRPTASNGISSCLPYAGGEVRRFFPDGGIARRDGCASFRAATI